MQTKKDAPTTEPTPIGTLDGFQATRIRLAQKSLSITNETEKGQIVDKVSLVSILLI